MGRKILKKVAPEKQVCAFIDWIEERHLEGKLFKAIAEQKFKLARILVEGGVNVNCTLRTGVTPLMLTCDQTTDSERKRMQLHLLRCLLRQKADLNAKDNFGRTALTYAFLSGNLEIVRILEVNRTPAWTWEFDLDYQRKVSNSVVIASSLTMRFVRWKSEDYAEDILQYKNRYNI